MRSEIEKPMEQQDADILLVRRKGQAARMRRGHEDPQVLEELVKALAPHPGGLRRWSVMRAIRTDRERASRPVSLKFEDEIERVFRNFCAAWADPGKRSDNAVFYVPEGKAGEVWAVCLERAKEWIDPVPPQAG